MLGVQSGGVSGGCGAAAADELAKVKHDGKNLCWLGDPRRFQT